MAKKILLLLETMADSQIYLLIFILLHFSFHVLCGNNLTTSYEVLLSWKVIDFKWSSQNTREWFIFRNEYIPESNAITGLKVRGSKVFLAVPRLKRGVPSTVNVVDLSQTMEQEGSPLVPYPNWDMQQVGYCDAFQNVPSIGIDRWGRMWVLDVGSVNILENREINCGAKLVLVDLERNEVVHKYDFPVDVVDPQTNFLNDIVLDCDETVEDRCYAYISDARDGKLIVYNFRENRSWSVTHRSMLTDPEAVELNVLGRTYTLNFQIDGIALSPKSSGHDRLYYTPISSYSLFSVPTSILKESESGINLRNSDVTTHAKPRSSQVDGLTMNENGILIYGHLQNNSVVFVDTAAGSESFSMENILVQDDEDFQWPGAFAFDDTGYLYILSDRFHCFSGNTCDCFATNTRVSRVFIGSRSYQYKKEGAVENISRPQNSLNLKGKSVGDDSFHRLSAKAGWGR